MHRNNATVGRSGWCVLALRQRCRSRCAANGATAVHIAPKPESGCQ
jgi:hypothetical protein